MRLRSKALVALIALSTAALSACGSSGGSGKSGSSPSGEPYTIGFVGALTGSQAGPWTAALSGVQGYAKYINDQGGVNGHPLTVVARDDGGTNVSQAQSDFAEMANSVKPSAVAGFGVSTTTEPVVAQYNNAQIPMVTESGASADDLKYPYLYISSALFASEGVTEVGYLKSRLKSGQIPRVALFTAGSPAGDAFKAQVLSSMSANGWPPPVLAQSLPVGQPLTNLTPQAQAVVSNQADYVLGTIFTTYPVPMMSALAQAGFTGTVINNYAGGSYALLQQVDSPNYYTTQAFSYLKTGSTADVGTITKYVKAVGGSSAINDADTNVTNGWVTAALIASGLKKCGFPCSGSAMKAALDSLDSIGNPQGAASGPVGFTASKHIAVSEERVFRYVNGKLEPSHDTFKLPLPTPTAPPAASPTQ